MLKKLESNETPEGREVEVVGLFDVSDSNKTKSLDSTYGIELAVHSDGNNYYWIGSLGRSEELWSLV